jgi:hypothetical protein
MTTEPEFTPAEQAELAAFTERAKIALGITKSADGEPAPRETPITTVVQMGSTPDAQGPALAAGLAALREAGLAEPVLEQVASDRKVTAAEHQLVADWKAARMKDQGYIKLLLSGDVDANRQMLAANVSLSAEIEN